MASSECNDNLLVQLNQSHGISRILLNDTTRKNALSKCMLKKLISVLDKIATDPKQKVVVMRGAGGVFCSGADLQWMKDGLHQSEEENKADAGLFYELFTKLNSFPKPLIIWVEKYAMGGALGLLACADYVIAEKDVQLAFSEVKLGLVPATIAPFVIQKIGHSQARALMLSAEVFTAKKAKRIGLIHEVVPSKEIQTRVDKLCQQFKNNSAQAMESTKQLISQLSNNLDSHEQKTLCINKIAEARNSEEGQEGVTAFFEKRQPKWYIK